MEQKYYIPQIEDLFVGYECELYWNQDMLPENKWYPLIVGEQGSEDIEWRHRVNKKEIRTPFLSNEDIKGEGWSIDFSRNSTSKNCYWKRAKRLDGVEQLFEMKYYTENNIIDIGYDCGEFSNCCIFIGKCPSINEFKKICKFLGI